MACKTLCDLALPQYLISTHATCLHAHYTWGCPVPFGFLQAVVLPPSLTLEYFLPLTQPAWQFLAFTPAVKCQLQENFLDLLSEVQLRQNISNDLPVSLFIVSISLDSEFENLCFLSLLLTTYPTLTPFSLFPNTIPKLFMRPPPPHEDTCLRCHPRGRVGPHI